MRLHQYEKYKRLGLNIAYYRKEKGLSQIELAEKIDISRTHMSRIETADCAVSLDVAFDICDALGIRPSQLFDFREQEDNGDGGNKGFAAQGKSRYSVVFPSNNNPQTFSFHIKNSMENVWGNYLFWLVIQLSLKDKGEASRREQKRLLKDMRS